MMLVGKGSGGRRRPWHCRVRRRATVLMLRVVLVCVVILPWPQMSSARSWQIAQYDAAFSHMASPRHAIP